MTTAIAAVYWFIELIQLAADIARLAITPVATHRAKPCRELILVHVCKAEWPRPVQRMLVAVPAESIALSCHE